MINRSAIFILLLATAIGCVAMLRSGSARADAPLDLAAASDQCKRASDKQTVIQSCSVVINKSRDPRLLERAYNRRGLAHEGIGQFSAAASDYTAVIRLDPKIAGYFDNRMRAYKGMGELDLALADADTAVRMAPTYPFVFHGRGAVRFDMGQYGLAVDDYSRALAINSADAPLLVDRGRALVKLGANDAAMTDFTSAHAVDPKFMSALRERGMLEFSLGRRAEARSDLSAALAAGLKDNEAAAALAALGGGINSDAAIAAEPRLAQNDASSSSMGSSTGLTPTQEAEQDAQRRLEAMKDAEAARVEAAARLKASRLAAAQAAARTLLGQAADFVKTNHDDPALLENLQAIADLNGAVQGQEPSVIERKTAVLSAALSADPLFNAFTGQHSAEAEREAKRDLAETLHTLAFQKTFLIDQVVHDPTGASSATFLSLAKQAEAGLKGTDLGPAQTLVGTIDAVVAKAGLQQTYAAAQQAAAAAEATQPRTKSEPQQ